MNPYRSLLAVALTCGVVILPPAAAGQDVPRISLEQAMTPAEERATGVAALTPAERAALERWLADYTRRVVEAVLAQRGDRASQRAAGSEGVHWVRQNKMHGGIIELEDGSEWNVRVADEGLTALWSPGTPVRVYEGGLPDAPNNALVVDLGTGERAHATRIAPPAWAPASGVEREDRPEREQRMRLARIAPPADSPSR